MVEFPIPNYPKPRSWALLVSYIKETLKPQSLKGFLVIRDDEPKICQASMLVFEFVSEKVLYENLL